MDEQSNLESRRIAVQKLIVLAGSVPLISTLGCSKLIVSSGKLLFGEPKVPSEFTKLTKDDLSNGQKMVLVVCSAPEAVESEYSTLKYDLVNGVTRQMNRNGVQIVKPDLVADWLDTHGGLSMELPELAQDFDKAEYIAWLDVQTFDLHEPNSPKLLRGQASGFIRVFKIEGEKKQRIPYKVYQTEFTMTYPEHQPVSEQSRGLTPFHKEYIARLSNLLAERFYDHRPSDHY